MGRVIEVLILVGVIIIIVMVGLSGLKDVSEKTIFCNNRTGIYLMPTGVGSETVNCSEYLFVNFTYGLNNHV